MDIKQSFYMAIRNLFANKVHFLHAMLGMVIGVAAVVFILAASISLLNFNSYESEEFAPGLVQTIVRINSDFPTRITQSDLEKVVADNPNVINAVSPYVVFEEPGSVKYDDNMHLSKYGDNIYEFNYVRGVNESYIDMITVLHLQEGRWLEYMDIARENKICVIESYIADEFFDGDALGKSLKICGENYTVVGVLANVPNLDSRQVEIFIPYTNARKLAGNVIATNSDLNAAYYKEQYYVLANGEEKIIKAQMALKDMFQTKIGRETGEIWTIQFTPFSFIVKKLDEIIYKMFKPYIVMAAIVLIIGGVGIMNVMLAAVQMRTKEIGIRKAFGATNKDIQRQFMLESVITSLFGGMLGIVLGVIAVFLFSKYMGGIDMGGNITFHVDIRYMGRMIMPILAAFSVSVIIGIIFGIYPASRAAEMEPIDAINSD